MQVQGSRSFPRKKYLQPAVAQVTQDKNVEGPKRRKTETRTHQSKAEDCAQHVKQNPWPELQHVAIHSPFFDSHISNRELGFQSVEKVTAEDKKGNLRRTGPPYCCSEELSGASQPATPKQPTRRCILIVVMTDDRQTTAVRAHCDDTHQPRRSRARQSSR